MSLCAKCGSACGNDCYTSPETIRKQEQERIIKLLETDKVERQPVCSDTDCEKCPAFERGFDRAIALIKGENK